MVNISFLPEHLFVWGGLSITNTLLVSWMVVLFLCFTAFLFSRAKLKIKPKAKSLQNVAEIAIEGLFNLIQSVTSDNKLTRKIFPLIATIFFFVLFSNWSGLIPGVGTIGFYEIEKGEKILVPFMRSPSADLSFTLAIAVISVLATQVLGITALGFFKYAGKFLNFKSGIFFFVGLLELASEATKMISFSFRLFGNVFAGEVLLAVILFLAPLIAPLPFLFLEVAVGLIQAFIFSMLTIVFIRMATLPAEH